MFDDAHSGDALYWLLQPDTMSIAHCAQSHGSRWTDRCLDDFLEMFDKNVTLIKVPALDTKILFPTF